MPQPSFHAIDLLQATHADLPMLRDLLHAAYAEYWGKLDPPVGAYDPFRTESQRTLVVG